MAPFVFSIVVAEKQDAQLGVAVKPVHFHKLLGYGNIIVTSHCLFSLSN